jgi:uncharacterized coiled-coil protein SlyX
MSDEVGPRLDRLEANLAHLENQVEQLNEVLIAQGKVVAQLKKQVLRQAAAMETLELERIRGNTPPPPHH